MADNQKRLISAEGIQLRTNRSIQVEGTFGVLKEDFQFKRFNHRGKDNVHKMLLSLALRKERKTMCDLRFPSIPCIYVQLNYGDG